MKREIKYRAWNTIVCRMSELMTLQELIEFHAKDKIQFQNLIWLQFTGLKDKNGKDIYEGDVIKDLYSGSLFTVVFGQHENVMCFHVVKLNSNYTAFLGGTHGSNTNTEIEVIGNIYENPELLTLAQGK